MSYILDALRKADAERERGTVPGIHAQPMFAGAAQTGPARTARPWVWALVAALMAALVAALVWALMSRGAPSGAAAPPGPVAAAAPPAAAPVNPAPVPAPALVPLEAAKPAPTPAPHKRKPVAPAPTRPIGAHPATEPAAAIASAKAAVRAGTAAPAPTPEGRVYTLNELPADIRRQLPAITIGGSRYSASQADRILIVNGQVLHEGDRITPDLVLEHIKLKAAVLAFKGYRYGITY
jgi:general secretion pathway protein B